MTARVKGLRAAPAHSCCLRLQASIEKVIDYRLIFFLYLFVQPIFNIALLGGLVQTQELLPLLLVRCNPRNDLVLPYHQGILLIVGAPRVVVLKSFR